jgi:hypothetical protein
MSVAGRAPKEAGRSVCRPVVLLGILLCGASARLNAQTISPVIVEYRGKAQGRFQLTNDSDLPLFVVLEPQSFSVDEKGSPVFRPLDSTTHVQLSTMSFRLAPRQVYMVFYKAEADRLPAWFVVYATITGKTAPTGLKIALELPHTVYLLGKKPLVRDSVLWLHAEVAKDKKLILAEVENHSEEFGRVMEIEVDSTSGKKEYAGFPLFPGQRRRMELDWDQAGDPQKIILKFEKFKAETSIQSTTALK